MQGVYISLISSHTMSHVIYIHTLFLNHCFPLRLMNLSVDKITYLSLFEETFLNAENFGYASAQLAHESLMSHCL